MQGPPTPTENDEASIPAEHLLTVPHLDAGSCKAAMRTFPWKLTAEELQLELSQPLQDEDEEPEKRRGRDLRSPFAHQQMKLLPRILHTPPHQRFFFLMLTMLLILLILLLILLLIMLIQIP
jgi:hypothetical protein